MSVSIDNVSPLLTLQSKGLEDLSSWDGQSPPTPQTYMGKPVHKVGDKSLPNFGPYAKEKRRIIAEENR